MAEASKYVVVRHREDEIKDAVKASDGGEVIETRDTFSDGGVVAIVEFEDGDGAVAFSHNQPRWDATVFDKLDDARRNASARAEGQ